MLVLSKHPTEWQSYGMVKSVFEKFVDDKTLVVDTMWSTLADYQDNIDRWLNNKHHKVIITNWWDQFTGYNEWSTAYKNNDRVLLLDYMASWFNICDEKFVQYQWQEVQPKSFENIFLCYQGKWKHARDALFQSLNEWSVPGIITLAGKKVLDKNIPAHDGNASIYKPVDYYPNDIYSLGDIDVWNSHFLNIVTETLDGVSYPTWITEKTIKPLAGSRPFIIYGDPNIYSVLNSFGIENFEEELQWGNVNYEDEFPMYHYQRLHIKSKLKELYKKDLSSLYAKCLPKCKHNFYTWRTVAKDQLNLLNDKVLNFRS